MTDDTILRDFAISFDLDEAADILRIKPGSRARNRLSELLAAAGEVARPKAAFKIVRPLVRDEHRVALGDVEFDSSLLVRHLEGAEAAFPYVATCGLELAQWAADFKGLDQFLAEEIMKMALRQGVGHLENHLRQRFGLPEVSAMNPGSLPAEWPITAQSPLFDLLGDLPGRIGIELRTSLLMTPPKSLSGVYFKTNEKFHNCQLCTKAGCPSRRAPYQNEGLGLGR